jgi:NADH-quinone oxidoreductase subunit J
MIETLLLYVFAAAAFIGAVLMLATRHPMRVALALIATMLSLAGIYALLGVHVIAVFQVLIYVGAVMVFMVFVIMLLDTRDPSFVHRYSRLAWPGALLAAILAAVLAAALGTALAHRFGGPAASGGGGAQFHLQPFSAMLLHRYWLQFELTSVLLLVAVVAAVAVIRGRSDRDG